MDNFEIANILNEIADILEIQGEDIFRVGAYRRAAEVIESLSENVKDVAEKGQLDDIPGVGPSIAAKITEFLKTGRLKYLEDLNKKVPTGLIPILEIPGMGPKTIQKFYKEFGVKNIKDLEKLLKTDKISRLEGFGPKSEENIKKGLEQFKRFKKRYPLGKIYPIADSIAVYLKKTDGVDKVNIAGSLRRMLETIGDIDILCTSTKPQKAIDTFCSMPQVKEVRVKGSTKAVVMLKQGIEADLRVVEPKSYGAALHYFTGSKAHNIHIRTLGIEKGLKINEYGIFKVKTGVRISGRTEDEIFKATGLSYIEPEIREDRGEIQAAQKGKLPCVLQLSDIKGDLHTHTNYSEGKNSVAEMADAAIKMGYEYILITDHTTTVGITHGMNEEKILKQLKEIDEINAQFKIKSLKFKILKGVECDIKADGSLDLPDKILEKLDIVVGAIHSRFAMDQTGRLIKACQNHNVDIIAHPTGRRLGLREAYEVDLNKVMDVCKKTNTFLELNAAWERLDLNDINCRKAKEKGIKLAISSDSHQIGMLNMMKYGVAVARRGWLEKKDIINTMPLDKLLKYVYND